MSGGTRCEFVADNFPAVPAQILTGTSVTPGASNAEGAWTQIFSAAAVSQDVDFLMMLIYAGTTSGQAKNHLLDIGVDPAGGTSYTPIISNIVCGASVSSIGGARKHAFPIRIKAGSSIAVRIQGNNATAGTVSVLARIFGRPTEPIFQKVGSYSETVGTITNSEGVAFTPGTAADGSWVLLGTTTRSLWWWNLCVQISNATMSGNEVYVEIAHGDGSNKHIIMKETVLSSTVEAINLAFSANLKFMEAYCPLPVGTNIYVRGRARLAPTGGYNAVAVGIGG